MKLFHFLALSTVLCVGACKKSDHPSNTLVAVKITVVSGNNQQDTVGRVLRDSIRVSVTRGNLPFPNAQLEIVQPGCAYSLTTYAVTGQDGTVSFPWQLNGTIGAQSLVISVVDSSKQVLDSTNASAIGLFANHGWLPAVCAPARTNALTSFASTPGGKVLYIPIDKIYYSDDNGATWSVLPSFPGLSGGVNSIVAYKNYIYVWNGSGLLYSSDTGTTWQTLPSVANFGYLSTVSITQSGKLFVSAFNGVYESSDMGQTWTNIGGQTNNGLGIASYYFDFCESADGSLFTVNSSGEVWESPNSGLSWAQLPGIYNVSSVYADSSGNVYMGNTGFGGVLYRMVKTANGITWSTLGSFPAVGAADPAITSMSESNGSFYFLLGGYGLMKTTDFVFYQNLMGPVVAIYCITKSGAGVVGETLGFNSQILYNLNP